MSSTSKQKSTSKNSKKSNQQEPTLEEIEEILREEVPTVLQNFITDTKYVFTGKDKYNRELILPYSVPTQVAIGGSAGYLAGLIGKKVGKTALVLVGAAAVMIPMAEHFGYLKINWKKVEKDVTKARFSLNKSVNKTRSQIDLDKAVSIAKLNPNLSLSAIGGLILGLVM